MRLSAAPSLLQRVRGSQAARLLALALAVLPVIHPLFRPALGPPSHLLWFAHVFPVAWATYVWGVRGAAFTIAASALSIFGGESAFGAGYGQPADEATRWALVIAVGATEALVSAFARWIRSAERERRDLERLATTALDASLDGVLLLDGSGRVRYANSVAARLFEAGGQPLPGRLVETLVDDNPLGSEIAGPTPGCWQIVARSGAGRLFPAEFRSSPVLGAEGQPRSWLVTVRDRTEELQHEEADRRAQALSELGTVVAGVAHELNNPLTTVSTYAELLEEHRATIPPIVAEGVEAIAHESKRAVGIVRQLLNGIRRRTQERTVLDVNAVLDRALAARAAQFAAHGIRVVRGTDSALPAVKGDPGEIEQIVVNLLSNAQYAMHRAHGGGTLVVSAAQSRARVEITVEDDGPGIPTDVLPRIFDPFFSTKGAEGTGLGLAIARRMARAHGGDLEASNRTGGGARFVLNLPVHHATAEPGPARPAPRDRRPLAPAVPGGASVLVVDDEPGIRRSLCRLLSARGYRVKTAGDTARARRLIESMTFDAILCDVHLPGGSGIELYRALQGRNGLLVDRFVLMTGDVLGSDVSAFLQETGCAHVAKPFEAAEVIGLLESVSRSGPKPPPPARESGMTPHASRRP